jgi:hypothetical protein
VSTKSSHNNWLHIRLRLSRFCYDFTQRNTHHPKSSSGYQMASFLCQA